MAIRSAFDGLTDDGRGGLVSSDVGLDYYGSLFDENGDGRDNGGTQDKTGTPVRGASRGLNGGTRVIASAINELITEGRADLRGSVVTGPRDLAALAQIYRNPKFETFRIFYTKGDTVVGHEGVTSRVPGVSSVFAPRGAKSPADSGPESFYRIGDRMARLGADGYWMLHNHPSGSVGPSTPDMRITSTFARKVPGFKGHVIIDTNEYALLSYIPENGSGADIEISTRAADFGAEEPRSFDGHPLLGTKIDSSHSLAWIAESLKDQADNAALIYTDAPGRVTAIQEVPSGLFGNVDGATDYIRGRAREFGAPYAFAVSFDGRNADNMRNLVETGVLTDSVRFESGTASLARDSGAVVRGASDAFMGRRLRGRTVRESAAKYSASDSLYTQLLDAYPEGRADALTDRAREMFDNAWAGIANNGALTLEEAKRLVEYALEQAEGFADALAQHRATKDEWQRRRARDYRDKLVSFDDGGSGDQGEKKLAAMAKSAAAAHREALDTMDFLARAESGAVPSDGALEPFASVEVEAEETPPDARPAPPAEQIPPRAENGSGTQEPARAPGGHARIVASDGTKLDGRYEVVPVGELVTSDTFDGAATARNPGYPQRLQNRDRSSASAVAQINGISQSPDPERLVARGTDAASGPPIVLGDTLVLSGNGRVMGLAQAAAKGRLGAYHDYLVEHAGEYGLDPFSIPEDGILVRKIDVPMEEAERLAPIMNASGTQALGAREQAASDAAMLEREGLLRLIDPGSPLTGAGNGAFVQAFASGVPEGERNAMLTRDGRLSDAGELRVRNAVFQHVYGDPDLTARLAEDRDSLAAKRVVNALVLAAPKFADYATAREDGLAADNDIIGALMGALDLYQSLRTEPDPANPRTVAQYAAQGKLLRQYSDEQVALAAIMEHLTSEKAATRFLGHYVDAAGAYDPNQMSLVPGQEPTLAATIDAAVRAYNADEATTKPLDVPDSGAVAAINSGHWAAAPTAKGSPAERAGGIQSISDRFDEELDQYAETGEEHVFALGKPSKILSRTGFPARPIELASSVLDRKMGKHDYAASDLKGLVLALQEPIAAFSYGDGNKAQNVIVDLSRGEKNLLVGVSFRGDGADITGIRTLFYKDAAKWLNWINQGKLLYADMNKLQALVNQQRTN
ncbi:MAG: hypothetical protein LBC21_03775, partial [Oscillospiraceae bacterium]|nr:hypothetical protein [Oscillospiraceae bacterium]